MMTRAPELPAMSTVFAVVGAHREDPDRLLLLGDDGRHYACRVPEDPAGPINPDDEEWALDPQTDEGSLWL